MATRSEQKEKRRQEILKIGLDLFINRGYAATKIGDIAKRANMSMGLLFHYFRSKEHLYEELIRIGVSGPELIMSGDKSDPLTFFESAASEIFRYATDDPATAKMFLLMKQAMYNEAAPDSVKELLKEVNTITETAAMMKAGQQNGTIREGNPTALSLAYWAAIQGICEELALNPGAPCPESDWVVDMIRRK